MAPSPIAKKLLLKPGTRALVINPPDGFLTMLEPLPDGASLASDGEGPFEFV